MRCERIQRFGRLDVAFERNRLALAARLDQFFREIELAACPAGEHDGIALAGKCERDSLPHALTGAGN